MVVTPSLSHYLDTIPKSFYSPKSNDYPELSDHEGSVAHFEAY